MRTCLARLGADGRGHRRWAAAGQPRTLSTSESLRMMKRIALLIAATQCLVGCIAQNDPRLKKADETATVVDSLKVRLDDLQAQVQALQTDVFVLQVDVNPYETAVFDPGI